MGLALYKLIYVSKSDAIGKTAKIVCSHPLPAGNTGTGQRHVGLGPQRKKKSPSLLHDKESPDLVSETSMHLPDSVNQGFR